jgi:hypothetical protein
MTNATYSTKVVYSSREKINFPDFTLEQIGEKIVPVPQNDKITIRSEMFRVTNGREEKEIIWSNGTGRIAPKEFTVGETTYSLEKSYSQLFGQLSDTELVITKKIDPTSQQKMQANYGEKVTYSSDALLQFPDFTLHYQGTTTSPSPNNAPWNMTYFAFTISDGTISKQIFWSQGSGDISPTVFTFNNKEYALSKGLSEKFGRLLNNEIVVDSK